MVSRFIVEKSTEVPYMEICVICRMDGKVKLS